MRFTALVAMALAMASFGSEAMGAIITNNFGLSSPVQTITFSEHVFADNTAIINQFSDVGITLSPLMFYSNTSSPSFPNTSGASLHNSLGMVDPIILGFTQARTEAAFVVVANPGTVTFTAMLGNVVVESFTATTNVANSNNYFGFSGIAFNQVKVDAASGFGPAIVLDNVELGNLVSTSAAVPEPATLAIWSFGALGCAVGAYRRRKKIA